MVPEINYWAVLIATASSMVVGSIWYTPKVFGTRWAKLANVDMDRPGASAVVPIVVTLIVSFITAWVLAGASSIAWHFYGGSYLWSALATGRHGLRRERGEGEGESGCRGAAPRRR